MEKKRLPLKKMLRVATNVIEAIIVEEDFSNFDLIKGPNLRYPEYFSIRLNNQNCLSQNSLLPIANYLDNEGLNWSIEAFKENTGGFEPYLEVTVYNHELVKVEDKKPF